MVLRQLLKYYDLYKYISSNDAVISMLKVQDGIMSAIELRCIPERGVAGVVQPEPQELARRTAAAGHQQATWLQGTRV